MKVEQTECSETSEYKIQTPGNYPEESIQQVSRNFLEDKGRPARRAENSAVLVVPNVK
jgi:hypothetical protein